jgi:hypothetical protein
MLAINTITLTYYCHDYAKVFSGSHAGAGQQTLIAAMDVALTSAGYSFEASPVRHSHAASILPDWFAAKPFT